MKRWRINFQRGLEVYWLRYIESLPETPHPKGME